MPKRLLLVFLLCVGIETMCSAASRSEVTSSPAQLDEYLEFIFCYFHGRGCPSDAAVEAMEKRREWERLNAYHSNRLAEHGLDAKDEGLYRLAWTMYLQFEQARKEPLTTGALARRLSRRLGEHYPHVHDMPQGYRLRLVNRNEIVGYIRVFSQLRELGIPVRRPHRLRSELLTRYFDLYDEGTSQSWASFHRSSEKFLKERDDYGDMLVVTGLLARVPTMFLKEARIYMRLLYEQTDGEVSEGWRGDWIELRTRREFHFPGSEGYVPSHPPLGSDEGMGLEEGDGFETR